MSDRNLTKEEMASLFADTDGSSSESDNDAAGETDNESCIDQS